MLVLLASGETVADRDKIFIGQGDSPITELGHEQISDAAETLAPYGFDYIYASDLYRAQETLRGLLRVMHHPVVPVLVEELRERSGGSYEGMSYTDIRKGMSPKQYKVWERDPFESPLHGESLMDVRDRLMDWVNMIRPELIGNKSILIITHPDVVRVIVSMIRGEDLADGMKFQVEQGIPYFYYGLPRM